MERQDRRGRRVIMGWTNKENLTPREKREEIKI
jgi:hypothetical protein